MSPSRNIQEKKYFRGFEKILGCALVPENLLFFHQIAFSYLYEQLVTFTRDFDAIKAALNKVEVFSKTCIETALNGVRAVIADEWNNTTNQVYYCNFS